MTHLGTDGKERGRNETAERNKKKKRGIPGRGITTQNGHTTARTHPLRRKKNILKSKGAKEGGGPGSDLEGAQMDY